MAFSLDQGLQLDSLWSSGDLHLENSLEDHGVSGQLALDKIAFEISVWQRCRPLQLPLTAHQLLRRREGVSVCWTCRTGDGPPSTLPWPWSSVTFIPSRLRLSSPVSCSRRRIWTWLHSTSIHRRSDLDLRSQCALHQACSCSQSRQTLARQCLDSSHVLDC